MTTDATVTLRVSVQELDVLRAALYAYREASNVGARDASSAHEKSKFRSNAIKADDLVSRLGL